MRKTRGRWYPYDFGTRGAASLSGIKPPALELATSVAVSFVPPAYDGHRAVDIFYVAIGKSSSLAKKPPLRQGLAQKAQNVRYEAMR